jgi:hypothetical protein
MANTEEVKEADVVVEKTKPTEPQTEEYEISLRYNLVKSILEHKGEAMKQLCFMQT